MKYHYQYVSRTSVRVQLIAEDPKEKQLLEKLVDPNLLDTQLEAIFHRAVENYTTGASVTKIRFMDFPNIALCSFALQQKIENVA